MKKFYFLFAIFFFSIYGAQIVNIPDANFKAKLLSANTTNGFATNGANQNIVINTNGDNEIQVSEALTVIKLNISGILGQSNNLISDLTGINQFNNLESLQVSSNALTNIQISGLSQLQVIAASHNQLTSFTVDNLISLTSVGIGNNQLSNFSITNCPNLQFLDCRNNQITAVDVSNFANLISLECYNNLITSITLNNNSSLSNIIANNNQLSTIDLSGAPLLSNLYLYNNLLTSIDAGMLTNLGIFDFSSNPNLTSFNVKNGKNNFTQGSGSAYFVNTPNLQYICADDFEIGAFASYNPNIVINSYCTFTPGGNFYTIQGNVKYDLNGNGCDISDPKKTFQKFDISTPYGMQQGISDAFGEYALSIPLGNYTITPILENPSYFNISPTSFTANFPTQTSPLNQNFCLTANGNHDDLEIVILPINAARPGFVSEYKVLFKNKGTATQAGSFSFNYDDNLMNLLSTSLATSSQSFGVLNYNFTNLLPFQTRELTVKFTLNTPTATPPLVGGDILNYTAQINGATDETPLDNTFALNQTVVNSFDPNDKTCLEGATIAQAKVGDYVHYVIRFENTGTANAENIVVKDMIDTSKYDVNSLVAMSGSHDFVTRITNPNTVEFIFENIQLPFNDLYNDGYVSFKIKTKSTLVLGDSFSNTANIYFDYNAPIVTNTATTTVAQILGTQESLKENSLSFYPNPVEDAIHFKTDEKLLKLEIYDVSGRIVGSVNVQNNEANLSFLKTGNYLIKIFTKDNFFVNKLIKK